MHRSFEFCRGRSFESFESFKEQTDVCIVYWNTRRYQTRLKGMTPVQYRGHSIGAA
ncbi:IS3 family transposase [Adlercreutzia mucosicola]|uniref:IS3 family transposase n=1 Tax=Adlercreutzia mucosicola TaxID=580026 RepID=UPI000A0148B5